jgi:hypothetical protein
MMARSKCAPFKGRIQKRKTCVSRSSNPACNTRPVHTKVPLSDSCTAAEFRKIAGYELHGEPDPPSTILSFSF